MTRCRVISRDEGHALPSWAGEETPKGTAKSWAAVVEPRRVMPPPPPPPPPPPVVVAPEPVVVRAEPDPAMLEALAEESYERGFSAGRTAAEEGLKHRFADLAKAIVALDSMKERLRKEAESDQVEIAMAVARRVLRREVHVDRDALRGLVSAAMEKAGGNRVLRVVCDATMKEGLAHALAQVATGEGIELVVDGNLPRGSVVFETQRGRLDASFESQLSEIENGLADQLRRA